MKLVDGYKDNSITWLTKETIKELASSEFPLVLNIETTNYCNQKCKVCAGQKLSRRKRGFMDWELFKKIIDECDRNRQLHILHFHKDGEPLMHPRILDMFRYAKASNCAKILHLTTNGTLFNKFDAEELLTSGIDDITVSVDAFNKDTYTIVKGVDKLDGVVEGTLELINTKKSLGLSKPVIRVKIMEYFDTYRDVDDFKKFWNDKADQVHINGLHDWCGSIKEYDSGSSNAKRWPCILLWYALAINWDGKVSVCNFDWNLSGYLGTITEKNTLKSIWKGKVISRARLGALSGKHNVLEICNKCKTWECSDNMIKWLKEQREYL